MWVALAVLAEAAPFLVAVTLLVRLLNAQQRAHARREDLLVNQLLHATGSTWQPPPAEEARRDAADRGFERPDWTAVPEQDPLE
jgi:hypothetical protein